MKIADARALICIHEATTPLSTTTLQVAVAAKYEKRYDERTLLGSVAFLARHGLISNELELTPRGKRATTALMAAKGTWAAKFFRPSDSPNVGPRAPKPHTLVAKGPAPVTHSGLLVVR